MSFQPKRNNQQGFTLLEIMLVIVLIGIATSAVVMTLPSKGNKESDAKWQTQHFVTLFQFAEDEALMTGREFALVFKGNSYQFTTYDYKKKKWLAIKEGNLSKKRELQGALRLKYTLTGSVWDQIDTVEDDSFIKDEDRVHIARDEKIKSFKPQVFIMSSGEVTPFSLKIIEDSRDSKHKSTLISVGMTGAISQNDESKHAH